jgi:hypothetical protein
MKKLICAIACGMMLQSIGTNALAGVRVQLKDNDGTPTSEWMRLEFKIVNDQPTSYDLSNTTLRYYFRDTSKVWSTALWSFLVNSSTWNTASVTASVAREPLLQDGFVLTLTFSSGKIDPNSDAWVLVGVHNETWKVNELDDYSYLTGTAFQDDNSIALYRGDEPVFGPRVLAAPQGNRSDFTVTSNPVISYDNRKHYSSDPVAQVVPVGGGTPVLYLATSTDLYSPRCGTNWWPPNWWQGPCGNDWPMDGVHLYTTSGGGIANSQWTEEGDLLADNTIAPIFKLNDFSGADVNAQHMFAPDLQYVPTQIAMFMYLPMQGTDGNWHIGTARAGIKRDGLPDTFVQSQSFFQLNNGTVASPIDPGVFRGLPGSGPNLDNYFMVYVDAGTDRTVGNISMAILHPDMVSGDNMGKLRFADPYSHYSMLTNYTEGPDVTLLGTNSNKVYYYMVFAAGDRSRWIGYAMCNRDDFKNDPLHCWNFKGWIFQDLATGNNHVNLVQYDNKTFIFYHRGSLEGGNHVRQVWAKEITLVDNPNNNPLLPGDGEIVGVTRPTIASIDKLDLYGSLNGTTTNINRAAQYIRNAINDDVAWSYVTLATADTFKEGEGIYNRFLFTGATNQEWVFDDVPAGTMIGSVRVPANAVRIRNMLTPDKRMNCGAQWSKDDEGPNLGLFNNTLNTTALNQVWIKEPVGDAPGAIRLRNLGTNNFLTRIASGQSDTFCKSAVSTNPLRQRWFIE